MNAYTLIKVLYQTKEGIVREIDIRDEYCIQPLSELCLTLKGNPDVTKVEIFRMQVKDNPDRFYNRDVKDYFVVSSKLLESL